MHEVKINGLILTDLVTLKTEMNETSEPSL